MAHTLLYSASAQPEGIVLELRVQQGGRELHQPGGLPGRQFCPRDAADALPMRERRSAPEQWLDVLDDLRPALPARWQSGARTSPGKRIPGNFVPFAGFNTENLVA